MSHEVVAALQRSLLAGSFAILLVCYLLARHLLGRVIIKGCILGIGTLYSLTIGLIVVTKGGPEIRAVLVGALIILSALAPLAVIYRAMHKARSASMTPLVGLDNGLTRALLVGASVFFVCFVLAALASTA